MEAKQTLSPIECIEAIHAFSKDSKLQKSLYESAKHEVKQLSDNLHTSEMETVLFANAFAVWYSDNTFDRVFQHFGMQAFQEVP